MLISARLPTPLLLRPLCSQYSHSTVVGTQAPRELGTLRAADGAEGYATEKK
jgi:hypothetical protein